MKCVILAGGKGTRIGRGIKHTPEAPWWKSGTRPMLWHIMKLYASFGVKEFIVCLGTRAT